MTKIFIVEDDESLRELYVKVLKLKGYEIIDTAIDGNDGVSKFKNLTIKPDILIIDHRMPNKNGYDAAKEILEIDNHAKIIFATADQGILSSIRELGIKYILEKPFSLQELWDLIENVVKID